MDEHEQSNIAWCNWMCHSSELDGNPNHLMSAIYSSFFFFSPGHYHLPSCTNVKHRTNFHKRRVFPVVSSHLPPANTLWQWNLAIEHDFHHSHGNNGGNPSALVVTFHGYVKLPMIFHQVSHGQLTKHHRCGCWQLLTTCSRKKEPQRTARNWLSNSLPYGNLNRFKIAIGNWNHHVSLCRPCINRQFSHGNCVPTKTAAWPFWSRNSIENVTKLLSNSNKIWLKHASSRYLPAIYHIAKHDAEQLQSLAIFEISLTSDCCLLLEIFSYLHLEFW